MAAPVPITTTLQEDKKRLVVKITIPTGGDANADKALAVDVSSYTVGGACDELKLMGIRGATPGFDVLLYWDATVDTHLYPIYTGRVYLVDFKEFGGIPNNAGAGKTGDVLLSTSSYSSIEEAVIILKFKKIRN